MAKIDGRVKRRDVYALASAADIDHRTARQYLEDAGGPHTHGTGEFWDNVREHAKALGFKPQVRR